MFHIWNDIITLGYGFYLWDIENYFFLQASIKKYQLKKNSKFLIKSEQQFFGTWGMYYWLHVLITIYGSHIIDNLKFIYK